MYRINYSVSNAVIKSNLLKYRMELLMRIEKCRRLSYHLSKSQIHASDLHASVQHIMLNHVRLEIRHEGEACCIFHINTSDPTKIFITDDVSIVSRAMQVRTSLQPCFVFLVCSLCIPCVFLCVTSTKIWSRTEIFFRGSRSDASWDRTSRIFQLTRIPWFRVKT